MTTFRNKEHSWENERKLIEMIWTHVETIDKMVKNLC